MTRIVSYSKTIDWFTAWGLKSDKANKRSYKEVLDEEVEAKYYQKGVQQSLLWGFLVSSDY